MKQPPLAFSKAWGMIALVVLVLTPSACTTLSSDRNEGDRPAATEARAPETVYYDFDDIEVPKELSVDRDDSFVYDTTGYAAGVLTLKGRVEFDSLVRFFEANMPKDNWRAVGHIKAASAMILFHKENRWCVITLEEGTYYTYARIWVAPTVLTLENTPLPPGIN